MKSPLRAALLGALLVIVAVGIPNQAFAQDPPSGAIFDLSTTHPSAFSPDDVFTQFTTSFVADNASEYVSFSFRDFPAFFSFDDATVIEQGGSTNLLTDGDFESDTAGDVGSNFPIGWSRWIQPVDVSFIGTVASTSNPESCPNSGPNTGTYFWCDGSVEGYDGLYQQLSGLTVGATYNVTWFLTENSTQAITAPTLDMLVYAGDALPDGTNPIGTPEPATLGLVGLSLVGVGIFRARLNRNARPI